MKKNVFTSVIAATAMIAAVQFSACKGKQKDTSADTTVVATDTTSTEAAPVTIAADDELKKGVKDATKDLPAVIATVDSGEITLTGDITRDKLQRLMMSLNTLHPKKINNKLTITK